MDGTTSSHEQQQQQQQQRQELLLQERTVTLVAGDKTEMPIAYNILVKRDASGNLLSHLSTYLAKKLVCSACIKTNHVERGRGGGDRGKYLIVCLFGTLLLVSHERRTGDGGRAYSSPSYPGRRNIASCSRLYGLPRHPSSNDEQGDNGCCNHNARAPLLSSVQMDE